MEVFRLVTLPSDDREFAMRVADIHGQAGAGASARAVVQRLTAELRPTYPHLRVRQQDRLASLTELLSTWYVYRDGDGDRGPQLPLQEATAP